MSDPHLQLLIDHLITALRREGESRCPDDAQRQKDERLVQWCGTNLLAYTMGITDVGELVADGVLVASSECDDWQRLWEGTSDDDAQELLTPERRDAIDESVYTLTDEERQALRLRRASHLFDGNTEDPAWYVVSLKSSDGTTAFLAMTASGGPHEGVEQQFVGVFETSQEARRALQRLGYLDEEDVRSRM